MLERVLEVQGIDDEHECCDMKDVTKDQAKLVGPHQDEFVFQQRICDLNVRANIEPQVEATE